MGLFTSSIVTDVCAVLAPVLLRVASLAMSPSHLIWVAARLHIIEWVSHMTSSSVQGEELREREEEGCRQTITDINKHAAAVMRAAGDTGPAGEGISADQVLDDLRRPELAGFSQLRIQDPKRLHSSAGPPHMITVPHQGAVSSLTDRDALNAAEVGPGHPGASSGTAHPLHIFSEGQPETERRALLMSLGPAQTLLEGGGHAQTMSSQAAYAVLVELCQHSSTASPGLDALAAQGKGAEQSLVPRMQARPCTMDAIIALLLSSYQDSG